MDQSKVLVLPQTNYLLSLMTIIRNEKTECPAFVNAFERVCGQLVPAALDLLPFEKQDVITPTGAAFSGLRQTQPVCCVSILRAGASMENVLRKACLSPLNYGKILIQRNEETCEPHEIYRKLPRDIQERTVLVLEPMLATGGSATKALNALKDAGVLEENIIFLNLVASQKGLNVIEQRFPLLRIVTAAVDEKMTASRQVNCVTLSIPRQVTVKLLTFHEVISLLDLETLEIGFTVLDRPGDLELGQEKSNGNMRMFQ